MPRYEQLNPTLYHIMQHDPHLMLFGMPFWFYPLNDGTGVSVIYVSDGRSQLVVSNNGDVRFARADETENDVEILNYFKNQQHQQWVFKVAQSFKKNLLRELYRRKKVTMLLAQTTKASYE